jgi:tRNA(fMet)-specific endonuclease VapC
MRYLLDTNICIYALQRKSQSLTKRIVSSRENDIAISMITVAALEYGVAKSVQREENRYTLMKFLSPFQLLEFSLEDAMVYGKVESQLRKKGKPIDPFDTLIAAQALYRKLIVVTNDKHFSHVPSLQCENWI